jgi:hypothetical protein
MGISSFQDVIGDKMSVFGFKKPVSYVSEVYTVRNVRIQGVCLDGVTTLVVESDSPRQHIVVPMYLIDKVRDDLTGFDLAAARHRRENQ